MRLGYFAMPMHPQGRAWAETLREDREAVILADRLGFHDAFIGEHLTDRHENITNSLVFLATLIPETTQIRLATGTTNLANTGGKVALVQGTNALTCGASPGSCSAVSSVLDWESWASSHHHALHLSTWEGEEVVESLSSRALKRCC